MGSESFTTGDGYSISYKVINGLRPPYLLFANGSIFNYKQFEYAMIPAFSKTILDQFSIILYDYIGIGDSSDVQGDYDFVQLADQQKELLDHLGIDQCHLFGFSKGAAVNQIVAAKYPERTLSMIAYGSPNLGDMTAQDFAHNEFNTRSQYVQSLQGIFEEKITDRNYDLVYDTVFVPSIFGGKQIYQLSLSQKTASSVVRKRMKPMLMGTKIESINKLYSYYLRSITDDEKQRYIDGMKDINAPTLLLHSNKDRIIPISASRLLDQWIPNSTFIELDKMGHGDPMLQKKAARQVMQHTETFLLHQ